MLMEANDNHEEEHTVAEFIEFCVNGRTSKSGEWTSKGEGKYLEGGKAAGGQLVDQRFCPRIVEGELRYNLVGDALVGVIHKKPKEPLKNWQLRDWTLKMFAKFSPKTHKLEIPWVKSWTFVKKENAIVTCCYFIISCHCVCGL